MAAEEAAILFWVGSSEMAAGSKSGINWGRFAPRARESLNRATRARALALIHSRSASRLTVSKYHN